MNDRNKLVVELRAKEGTVTVTDADGTSMTESNGSPSVATNGNKNKGRNNKNKGRNNTNKRRGGRNKTEDSIDENVLEQLEQLITGNSSPQTNVEAALTTDAVGTGLLSPENKRVSINTAGKPLTTQTSTPMTQTPPLTAPANNVNQALAESSPANVLMGTADPNGSGISGSPMKFRCGKDFGGSSCKGVNRHCSKFGYCGPPGSHGGQQTDYDGPSV